MRVRSWALAVAGLLWTGGANWADEVIRLGGVGDAKVTTLEFDGSVDTELAHYRRGVGFSYYGPSFGFSYHSRPYYARSYYARPYYHHHHYGYGHRAYYNRPYYASFHGPSFSFYYARPYRFYRDFYAYSAYDYPSHYYAYPSYYYYPCSVAEGYIVTLNGTSAAPRNADVPSYYPPRSVIPPASGNDATFPYDGGPKAPTLMPGANPAPASQPERPTVPREGRIASLPAPADGARFMYAAYGEQPRAQSRSGSSTFATQSAAAPRIVYPAYGEQPSSFATDRPAATKTASR